MVVATCHVYDPGGNVTALVEAPAPLDLAERGALARSLLAQLGPDVEQVGFVTADPEPRLDMMGGELCLNALRCAGWWANAELGLGSSFRVMSGESGPVSVVVDGKIVTLRLAMAPQVLWISPTLCLVRLDGIAHFVDRTAAFSSDPMLADRLDALAREHAHHLQDMPAVGLVETISLPDRELHIKPLVKVIASKTLYFETACGSGSVAAALAACFPCGMDLAVIQPSGSVLKVRADEDAIVFSGPVRPVSRWRFDLDRAKLQDHL